MIKGKLCAHGYIEMLVRIYIWYDILCAGTVNALSLVTNTDLEKSADIYNVS